MDVNKLINTDSNKIVEALKTKGTETSVEEIDEFKVYAYIKDLAGKSNEEITASLKIDEKEAQDVKELLNKILNNELSEEDKKYINLMNDNGSKELSEKELETVAGGWKWYNPWSVLTRAIVSIGTGLVDGVNRLRVLVHGLDYDEYYVSVTKKLWTHDWEDILNIC